MKIKLASSSLGEASKSLDYKDLVEILAEQNVVFLDHETDASVFSKLEKDFERVIASTVKYGLAEGEFVYEVHVIA